jgi:hypothetical protein
MYIAIQRCANTRELCNVKNVKVFVVLRVTQTVMAKLKL